MLLRPTTASGLSEDYAVRLPAIPINLEVPKVLSTERTISGSAVISKWEGSILGEERNINAKLAESEYQALKAIKDTGVDEWLLVVRGKIYKVIFDLVSAVPIRGRHAIYETTIRLIFLEDLTA